MLVTAVELVDEPADYARLIPMLQRAEETTGVKTPLTLADAGYHSAAALQGCADRGQQVAMPESPRGMALDHPYHKDQFTYDSASDTYRCPQGQVLSLVRGRFARKTNKRMYRAPKHICQACPVVRVCITRGSPSRSLVISPYDAALRRHRAWMATDEARSAFKKRTQLVEPVFGIIKEQRGYEGSCCVVLATSLPNGPCWPLPSTCGLCGVHGVSGGRIIRTSRGKPCSSHSRQHD